MAVLVMNKGGPLASTCVAVFLLHPNMAGDFYYAVWSSFFYQVQPLCSVVMSVSLSMSLLDICILICASMLHLKPCANIFFHKKYWHYFVVIFIKGTIDMIF